MSGKLFQTATLNVLYRYGIALTGTPQDAQDILHTSLEKYLKSSPKHIDNEPAFVRKIMRNVWYDELRKKRRQHVHQTDSYDAQQEPIDLQDKSAIENIIMTDQLLQTIWLDLDDPQRELLFFSCVLEFSAQQIADELETPRGTILARLHRLKKRLRDEYTATYTQEAKP